MNTSIYAYDGISFLDLRFENDVNMYGIQTPRDHRDYKGRFENDVNMYGIQTFQHAIHRRVKFENDVNMYGIQTTCSFKTLKQ